MMLLRKIPAACVSPIIITGLLLAPSLLMSQYTIPSVPDVNDVELNAVESVERCKAKLTLYGKEPLQGEVAFTGGASINPSGDPQRIYPIREISRITITSWIKNRKGKEWIFYPSGYEIILKNQTRLSHSGNIEFLNRFRFTTEKGEKKYLYTYYYDYLKKGKWINTGTEGAESLPSRPANGTVYIIELK